MGWGVRGGARDLTITPVWGLERSKWGGHRGAKFIIETHSNLVPEPRTPEAGDKTALIGGKVYLPQVECCPPPLVPTPKAPCAWRVTLWG